MTGEGGSIVLVPKDGERGIWYPGQVEQWNHDTARMNVVLFPKQDNITISVPLHRIRRLYKSTLTYMRGAEGSGLVSQTGMQEALNTFDDERDGMCPNYIVEAGQTIQYYPPGSMANQENLYTGKVLEVHTAEHAQSTGCPFSILGHMDQRLSFDGAAGADDIQIKEPFQTQGWQLLTNLRYKPGPSINNPY